MVWIKFVCELMVWSADGIRVAPRLLVRAKCVRTNIVRVLADVVATKLGIIIYFSFHVLFSQKGFAYDFEFLHDFLSNKENEI